MRIEGARVAARRRLNLAGRIANSIRFPFNGFTYFLTLFSKSFLQFYLILTFLLATRRYVYFERICRSHFFSILSRKWIGCQYFPENCRKHLAQEQFVDLWINKEVISQRLMTYLLKLGMFMVRQKY